ncbi:MAG: hypothetical protein WB586_16450 [Chthoniobacterales bacterium]
MKEREPRVFMVDDDQSVRTSLATLLSTEDYAVEIFARPTSTWRACRTPARRASCSTCGCRDSTASPSNGNGGSQNGADRLHHRARRIYRWGLVR